MSSISSIVARFYKFGRSKNGPDQVEKTEKKPIYFTSSFKISCLF
ncbi:hypothetical protein LEP1GSC187_1195 [Leptospira santarosai str. ZUN179]|uniref:Uncharacterized protein n=1 Tax=Leptospira santarosai str. ZUN179 TaxID=1049985 RepID=M6UR41_9LEPT|nr:hypothetical protein LEP1GSC187_1195 [Leptospira santarosai str. ZUN179]